MVSDLLPPDHVFAGLRREGYGCIVADPPWLFRARTALQMSNWTSRRDAEKHYAVMGIDDIASLPVRDLAAPDCHLFLWITGPLLVEGKHVEIMKTWGFRPSSVGFTWIKLKKKFDAAQLSFRPTAEADLHVGLGLTTRKNAEFCLIGRRGNCRRDSKRVREIIMAPVREHSRKPDEFRRRVAEYIGPGVQVCELFARERHLGWDAWGLEIDKFQPDGAAA
jgi:N6-adenosine-specific RNA methylase IME4